MITCAGQKVKTWENIYGSLKISLYESAAQEQMLCKEKELNLVDIMYQLSQKPWLLGKDTWMNSLSRDTYHAHICFFLPIIQVTNYIHSFKDQNFESNSNSILFATKNPWQSCFLSSLTYSLPSTHTPVLLVNHDLSLEKK